MLLSLIPCWQLSLSVLAAVMTFAFAGIIVSRYRGRSRLGAMLFTLPHPYVVNGVTYTQIRIRHATRCLDPEAGLYIYPKRVYSPDLRRWLTRDPLGEDGGPNLYSFCRNDPISHHDALGQVSVRFISEDSGHIKRQEVSEVRDILIEQVQPSGYVGAFMPREQIDDCGVVINLIIRLRYGLDREVSLGRSYEIVPHSESASQTGKSKIVSMSGHEPLWGAELAHERGHAASYLINVRPRLICELRNLPRRIDAEQRNHIVKIHRRLIREESYKSGALANQNQFDWFREHGFVMIISRFDQENNKNVYRVSN